MSKKSLLDAIEMPAPCSKDWKDMTGDEKVRFCHSCGKNVVNIAAYTRSEAKKILKQSSEKPCIRLVRDSQGNVQTSDKRFYKIASKRASRIAAGVLGASLTLSVIANAQETQPNQPQSAVTVNQKDKDKKTSRISFTITDPNGAVVPNAEITLTNQKTKETFAALTNEEGYAQLDSLPQGHYELKAKAGYGFIEQKRLFEIEEENEPNIKITLEVASAIVGVFVDNSYERPLLQAISQSDIEEVKRLKIVPRNANTKEKKSGLTALHVAVETGNIEIVRMLLDAGARVNAKSKAKQTPLLMIDDDATPELVRLLIERGASVNVQDDEGETALMKAAEEDKLEIVKILLEAGADVHLKDKEGETVLDHTFDDDIEKLLKQYGAFKTEEDN